MKKLIIFSICTVSAVLFYQNRYRVMNTVLGQPRIRQSFIHFFLKIPFIRNKFIQHHFRNCLAIVCTHLHMININLFERLVS